ncbi:hypothetical protein SLH49_06875 [Cognatiyoonia sp. IB215446]|uniref:hypothetical protein n=1 Tax=Cognatiyoonia sp. IB215446 TaxID=3097355 RepID=UPI002A12B4BE|nr:hypothetical protein [Cognatiyoonia sp. IB215446]MDX8347705.1 hypothetical protein [Cognatiyoonia sp. IB215446]
MTRLSISMAAAFLTMTLTPAAQAYGTDPAADTLSELTQIGLELPSEARTTETCQVRLTPAMAELLGLPSDWRDDTLTGATKVACNAGQ